MEDTRMRKLIGTLIHKAEELFLKPDGILFRCKGRMVRMEIDTSPGDSVEFMRSITPEQNWGELDNDEQTEFDFELSEDAWVHVSMFGTPGDYRITAKKLFEQN
jgi:hypothetical protein